MHELLFSGFNATDETKKALDAEWQVALDHKPMSWLKDALPGTIPGSTARLSHGLPKMRLGRLSPRSKKVGLLLQLLSRVLSWLQQPIIRPPLMVVTWERALSIFGNISQPPGMARREHQAHTTQLSSTIITWRIERITSLLAVL